MKKILLLIIILMIVAAAILFYVEKTSLLSAIPEQTLKPAASTEPSPSFDTSDHLDQSLNDLNAIDTQ